MYILTMTMVNKLFLDGILVEIMVNIGELWLILGASVMVYINWRTATNHLSKGFNTPLAPHPPTLRNAQITTDFSA